MKGNNSGLVRGTSGSPQTSLEQNSYFDIVNKNENSLTAFEEYIRDTLPKSAPIKIPKTAVVKSERKNGYSQLKYSWQHGKYKYQCRWHTRTPGAPEGQGDSWVVEKRLPGIGSGPNARPSKQYVMVDKHTNGSPKWVDKKTWNAAIRARKNGNATKKQKEMLDNGHWKA